MDTNGGCIPAVARRGEPGATSRPARGRAGSIPIVFGAPDDLVGGQTASGSSRRATTDPPSVSIGVHPWSAPFSLPIRAIRAIRSEGCSSFPAPQQPPAHRAGLQQIQNPCDLCNPWLVFVPFACFVVEPADPAPAAVIFRPPSFSFAPAMRRPTAAARRWMVRGS